MFPQCRKTIRFVQGVSQSSLACLICKHNCTFCPTLSIRPPIFHVVSPFLPSFPPTSISGIPKMPPFSISAPFHCSSHSSTTELRFARSPSTKRNCSCSRDRGSSNRTPSRGFSPISAPFVEPRGFRGDKEERLRWNCLWMEWKKK